MEAGGVAYLLSLPDILIAHLWPPESVIKGICVGSKDLKQALLAAPSLNLGTLGIRQVHFAGTLKSMTNLRELDLSRNVIGDEGAKALAGALVLMPTLQALDLR